MANVTILTHGQYPVNAWDISMETATQKLKIKSVESVKVLGDGVPSATSWASNTFRTSTGIKFEVVVTDWKVPADYVRRNEVLLTGTDYVLVFGELATRSATEVCARAFTYKGIHVVQVMPEGTSIVGRDSVKVTEKMRQYLTADVKPAHSGMASFWSSLAPSKSSKITRSSK